MKFRIITLLYFAFSSNALDGSSAVNVLALEQNPCDTIRNGQFVCKDCTTMAFCVQKENGWETISIGTCSGSLFCDEEARGCTYQNECPLASRAPRFQCQQPGTFPDPYDCKHYHDCNTKNEDERKSCASGTAYSPVTRSCSLSSSNEICDVPRYNCPQLGYMAAWPSDSNIYYVCLVQQLDNGKTIRYPVLYRCPNGQIFQTDRCISATANNIPSTTGGSITLTTEGSTCSAANGLVASANDCSSYSVCMNGILVSNSCPSGTYFDSSTASCRFGTC